MLLNKSEEAARENASLFEHFHNHPNYTNGLKSRLVCREVSYSNIYGKIANRTKKLLWTRIVRKDVNVVNDEGKPVR